MTSVDVCHVLHLSQKPGSNPISGAERHVLTLLAALASRGARAELIALIWNDGPLIRAHLAELEARGVVVTRISKTPASTRLRRVMTAAAAWSRLCMHLRTRRDAIVHLHLELVAPVLAARLARCARVVATIHNDEPHYRTLRWRIWLAFVNRVVRQYIAISTRVARHFSEAAGTAPVTIRTVVYGLDPPKQVPQPRRRLGLDPEAFVVGFLGRLVPQKNPELLLRAAADWPECVVAIVGAGPLEGRLNAVAAELGLTNVKMLGPLADGASVISAFDILCVPSRWEGFGLNVLEAMLSGVPVVATATGALPELLDAGRCGVLVTPESADELRIALRSLAADAPRRRELAARAYERATSFYTVRRMVDETLDVYAGARLAG